MSHQVVNVAQAKQLLAQESPTVLDTRDAARFGRGHIPGAERLSDPLLAKLMRTGARRRPTLLYCYHGNTSQEMSRLLVGMGFSALHESAGGWQAWEREGGEVALPEGARSAPGIDQRDERGMTPLMRAAVAGDLRRVSDCIARGADPAAVNNDGNNALWFACFGGNARLVELLIRQGVPLDQANETGATALHYCASSGKPDLVGLLLRTGADPTRTTQDGFSALDLAADIRSLRQLRSALAA